MKRRCQSLLAAALAVLMLLGAAYPTFAEGEVWAAPVESAPPALDEAELDLGATPEARQTAPAEGEADGQTGAGEGEGPAPDADAASQDAVSEEVSDPASGPDVPALALSPAAATLGVGETLRLTAILDGGETPSAGARFATSNKKIATVDAAGLVRGVKTGSATITVTAGDLTASCAVKVVKAPSSVKLSDKALTLAHDAERQLGTQAALGVTLSKGSSSALRYTGYDAKVVEVTGDGALVATGVGTTTVTVQTYNKKKASCKVTVLSAPQSVALSAEALALGVGGSAKLGVKLPAGTAGTWYFESDAPEVADVDAATGAIRALAEGETVVTVRCFNGVSNSCLVTVLPAPDRLTLSVAKVKLGVGESLSLSVEAALEDGAPAAATLKYASSNAKVAEVNAAGVVKARKRGAAKITVTAQNGVSAVCEVQVAKAPTSIKLSASKLTLGYDAAQGIGMRSELKATLSKDSASALSYAGYDPAVVAVGADGSVTAVGPGTTKITVSTFNKKKATCAVTVLPAPERMELTPQALILGAGQRATVKPVLPQGTAASLTFASDAEAVASVDASGRVTAEAPGEATVTARAFNGVAVFCPVTVLPAPSEILVAQQKLTLGAGETAPLPEIGLDVDVPGGWTIESKSAKIARLNGKGGVTGVKQGSTSLTITTYNGLTKALSVTVAAKPTAVTLSAKTLYLEAGETGALSAKLPKGQAGAIAWKSSDEGVATVSADGVVTAVGQGDATVTAKTYNGKSASCAVHVIKPAAHVEFDSPVTLVAPLSAALPARVLDEDGAPYKGGVQVSVSPSEVAEYTDGKLWANAPGTATLTVTAGAITASCEVTVIPYGEVHPVKAVAHRGACGYWPENTLEAFRNAPSTGADYVELDVQRTADDVLVVHHDKSFYVGGSKYTLRKEKYATLKKLKPSLCTLDEALDVIAATDMDLFLELKEFVDSAACVKAVRRHGMQNRTFYFSFWPERLKEVQKVEPKAKCGVSLENLNGNYAQLAASAKAAILVVNKAAMNQKVTDLIHRAGLEVCVWTVDDAGEIAKLRDMGVDYILSNVPDKVVQAR